MNINAIIDGIFEIKSLAELKIVSGALKGHWNELSRRQAIASASQFKIGDLVEWDSKRYGDVIQGTIEKFGPKNVVVNTKNGTWRVHPSFLRPAKITPSA